MTAAAEPPATPATPAPRDTRGTRTRHARPESLRHFRLRRGGRSLQPPLTPMIDVVFQLLLFFLLTMQFRQAEGRLPATLPAAPDAPAVTPLEPLDLRLVATEGGELLLELPQVDFHTRQWGQLRSKLRSLAAELDTEQTPLRIVPSPGVDWNAALNAYNQARLAGMKNIQFQTLDATLPPE